MNRKLFFIVLLLTSLASVSFSQSFKDKLVELNNLKLSGMITEKEFSDMKMKLLNSHFIDKRTSSLRQSSYGRSSHYNSQQYVKSEKLIIAVKINKRAKNIVKFVSGITIKSGNRVLPSKEVSRKPDSFIVVCKLDRSYPDSFTFLASLTVKERMKKSGNYTPWQNKTYKILIPTTLRGTKSVERIIEFIENKGFFETTPSYKLLTKQEYAFLISKRKMQEQEKNESKQMLGVLNSFIKSYKKKKQ